MSTAKELRMGGWSTFLLVLLVSANMIETAKILVVFPFPGKSHSILGQGITKILAKAGHEITFITPFPVKESHPKIRQIDVSSLNSQINFGDSVNITAIMNKEVDVHDIRNFFTILLEFGKMAMEHENVQKLINEPSEDFDVVIVEYMYNDVFCGLPVVFSCPFIYFSSIEPDSGALMLIDEPLNPAYNPSIFGESTVPFSFIERIKELFSLIVMSLLKEFYSIPTEKRHYEEIFGPVVAKKGKTLPPFELARFNASLMLGNSHVSLGQPTRLPQNYKPIGGYHIGTRVEPLPEDLQKIMDSATHGVIYFSMGSNLKSKDISDQMKKDLLRVFGARKETVIWKFEETLSDLPKNVHILKWAPQPGILAHSKCKVFITHGGLLSTTEAVHFGVPLIGIPVFGDQFMNVQRAAKKGFLVNVDLSHSLPLDIKAALDEVIGNPKYGLRAKELSQIYHDRPATPDAETVHWVEHVVRTRGAVHLRSPAIMVPWYQKWYLDFFGLVVALLLVTIKILKAICQAYCSNKKSNNNKMKKKN